MSSPVKSGRGRQGWLSGVAVDEITQWEGLAQSTAFTGARILTWSTAPVNGIAEASRLDRWQSLIPGVRSIHRLYLPRTYRLDSDTDSAAC